MPYTYSQYKLKVAEILMDKGEKLELTECENFLREAIKIYSKHRPCEFIKDITGDGTYDYAIATYLTSWVKDFSIIKSLEYPADQRDPQFLEDDDYLIYEKETGQIIRFVNDNPGATEKIRVSYTGLHILRQSSVIGSFSFASANKSMNRISGSFLSDGIFAGNIITTTSSNNPGPLTVVSVTALKIIFSEDIVTAAAASITVGIGANTIPESDQDALCNLAASLCSGALASIYVHMTDSTITADSVDHKSKSQEFTSRAEEQKKNYLNHLGIKEGEVTPASAVKDLDVNYPWGGDRLTHPKKWR